MRWLAALIVFALTCSAAQLAPAAALTPLVAGWEQYFKLEWSPPTDNGRISGYILNDWGSPANRIQLLVEGLDQAGQVVNQRVEWLGTMLTPGMRAYFEVRSPGPAPTYRVRVFAFDWIQSGGNERN